MTRRRPAILLATFALAATGAVAEKLELVTDRPDQTESSVVIPPDYLQIEAGATYTDGGGDREVVEGPGTLLRVGLVNRAELRFGWDGWVREDAEETIEGRGDGEVGTKIALWKEQGWIPETAWLGALALPFGDDDLSGGHADPSFRFCMSHTLSDALSLGYNLGASRATDEDVGEDDVTSFVYTVALGSALGDRAGCFVEAFGEMSDNAAAAETHSVDGGVTWLLADNVQLDATCGFGLNDEADDWFVGAGISCRLPE